RVMTDSGQAPQAGSEIARLEGLGVPLKRIPGSGNAIMHNKYAIFDSRVLLTGSYNWSETAETRNFENAIFIREFTIVNSYQGYFVATARTGTEALEATWHGPGFDVVLLDLFIPDIGGLEVLAEISRLTDGPSVILVTGLADKEIAHDALKLGAFDYILKPYN